MHWRDFGSRLIAVLNGHALGGGLELAACADFRIAEEHVRIGAPEIGPRHDSGLVGNAAGGAPIRGAGGAADGGTGRDFHGARKRCGLGLVDKVVLRDAGPQAAQDCAQRIAARGPVATQLVKALINAAEGEDGERALEMAAGAFAATTDDLKEGVAAFRGKRKPEFGGK